MTKGDYFAVQWPIARKTNLRVGLSVNSGGLTETIKTVNLSRLSAKHIVKTVNISYNSVLFTL